ncbi:MAG: CpsD/CapB family tyrosine-protein kinase [bacterium]
MNFIEKALRKSVGERRAGLVMETGREKFETQVWEEPTEIDAFDKHIVSLLEPTSVAAEQYRVVRTFILKAGKDDLKRVFLISSAMHGEGKTLTALNLAISIVRGLQETVLLIDADFRNPTLSRLLGMNKVDRGIIQYLTTNGELGDFILKTSISKLNILIPERIPENPSELIGSEKMANLLKEVRCRYENRYIIIDSPPLFPVSDSIILSALVDGVILVARAQSTPREQINEAIEKIENKENILGIVINSCKKMTANYGYQYK